MAVALAPGLLLERNIHPPEGVSGRVPGSQDLHAPPAMTAPLPRPARTYADLPPKSWSTTPPASGRGAVSWRPPEQGLKWSAGGGNTIKTIDRAGVDAFEALTRDLARRGLRFAPTGFRNETRDLRRRAGARDAMETSAEDPTRKSAISTFPALQSPPRRPAPDGRNAPAGASGEQGAT